MKRFVLALVLWFAWGIGHAITTDDLIGLYAVEEKGQLHEVLKIEKVKGRYIISEKRNGKWRRFPTRVTPVTDEQFEKLIKQKIDFPYAGLSGKQAAVFKVPSGWSKGKFRTESGYFMFLSLGPVELVKQQ